ncbi:MAG: aminopeptidase P family protein [Anaerolineae bacterium]|nr:aminopeptidase P family protein [Anaerolineae bacterium]
MNELAQKEQRIHALLKERGLGALLLRRISSFAWATGGASGYVNTAADVGAAALLFTPQAKFVLTTNIEATRLEKEERLAALGFTLRPAPWYEGGPDVAELAKGLKLGADGLYPGAADLSAEVSRLRMHLLPEEQARYRALGKLCGEAIAAAIRRVRPGQTEYEIAALLAEESMARGALPIVNLIATDERIFAFRHPLPTAKKLEKYAMLVLCGRKEGLVASVTRLVHFGRLPEELRRKSEAVARLDATVIAASRPGARLSDIFRRITETYAATGFPDEWRLHHQGGPASYEPREMVATPTTHDPLAAGMACAWNPSITGTKSEDTILVGEQGNEVLTASPDWPLISVTVDGKAYARPAIWEVG